MSENIVPKPGLYKTGSYYVISSDGTPGLIGKVTRRRAGKAVISILNGCWHATFDEIGMHHSRTGTVYLVEAEVVLPPELVKAINAAVGTEVIPHVERALYIWERGTAPAPPPPDVLRVYYGKSLADIKSVVPKGTFVFEELFKHHTFFDYEHCWTRLRPDVTSIICKTSDALEATPPGTIIIRVGRSIRTSEKGKLIKIERTKEEFQALGNF